VFVRLAVKRARTAAIETPYTPPGSEIRYYFWDSVLTRNPRGSVVKLQAPLIEVHWQRADPAVSVLSDDQQLVLLCHNLVVLIP
jgi:hypothetical protein